MYPMYSKLINSKKADYNYVYQSVFSRKSIKKTGNISNEAVHEDVSHINEIDYSYHYQPLLSRKSMKETGNTSNEPVYEDVCHIDQQ